MRCQTAQGSLEPAGTTRVVSYRHVSKAISERQPSGFSELTVAHPLQCIARMTTSIGTTLNQQDLATVCGGAPPSSGGQVVGYINTGSRVLPIVTRPYDPENYVSPMSSNPPSK